MIRRSLLTGAVSAVGMAGMMANDLLGSRVAAAPINRRIPDVEVWTHDGRRLRFYDDLVKNRVVTFNFMFVGCGGVCPLVTANLRRVQELLDGRVGRDIFMYSITLRPELERPEDLRNYAQAHGIGSGWQFLTGAPADIERLRVRLGFTSLDPELDVIADEHTGLLRYGNEALDRWAATAALARPEWIAKAITSSVALG